MRLLQLKQHIVFKGFFKTLIALSCALCFLSASARAASFPQLNASQIAQLAKGGNISQAATSLAGQSGLPIGGATQFIQSLQGGKIDIGSATNLIGSVLGGKNINTGNIGDVTKMLQGLQNGQANPAAIAGLINKVAGGALPANVGKALSSIQNLGNLTNIKSISDVFKNPQITQALSGILNKAGLPPQATQALQSISSIAQIASNPQALLQNPAAAAQAITNILKSVAPQLAKQLEKLLGGNLAKSLTALLGGSAPTTPTTPTTPNSSGGSCGGACPACSQCAPHINKNHQIIRAHVTSEFEQHRNWIVTTYFLEHILPSMMLMTTEFTTNMMQQVQIIGGFFDAKHQLETQRIFQQMTAKTHKDYHPSEELCTIGTNVRSLASSERRSNLGQVAFANRMLQRELSSGENLSIHGKKTDRMSRVDMFIKKFCDKDDHAKGLAKLCKDGGKNKKQINMDIDFTSAFENKLTLDIDFTKKGEKKITDDEENIFALSANLFANEIPKYIAKEALVDDDGDPTAYADWYLDLRAITAKRSVAQNSFAAITTMKSEGDDEVAPFLKAILIESGINKKDIEERLGKKPSYFAQMEVLTKDLYQNPTFYANLYDKPVNVERKATALQAIELMQDRDIYRSLIRSEAVLATLIETLLRKQHAAVSSDLNSIASFSETNKKNGGP